jgi:hypothetical protein
MTDGFYGFAPAAPTWVPVGSFTDSGVRIDLGGGVSRTGLNDPFADDHAPTPAAPAVVPVSPRAWLSARGMTEFQPDAVDAVLISDGSDRAWASEQADEQTRGDETNIAAVVMGVVALAWRVRTHLGQPDNDRDRRHRYPDPKRRLPGGGLGLN